MSVASARQRLEDHVRDAASAQVIAVGWATVDLDRAAQEVGSSLGFAAEGFIEAPDSLVLGARCRLAPDALDDGVGVILMEPFTEGRLAASLARHDEGPIAIWHRLPPAGSAARGLSAEQAGPLGGELLGSGSPVGGPYRLVVVSPGTIPP